MRTKDRLAELAHLASSVHSEPAAAACAPPAALSHEISELLDEVERVRGWLLELQAGTRLLRRLHADPTFHANEHIQEQLESTITQSNAVGLKVCGALRQLQGRAADARGRAGAASRMARLHYAAARAAAADALAAHHDALGLLRDQRRQLLLQQLALTNFAISDEECQSLLDTNDVALFVDNVGADTAAARLALREVEARQTELARAEGSLREVRDLFVQLAHLVASQQEQIDSVEYFALQATEHVEYGGQELLKGTVSRAKAGQKKMGLLLCLAVGFAVVVVVLVLT